MIEPLRYHIEKCLPYAIPKPIFCQRCLSNKKTRDNPKLVIKYCDQCPRCQLLCKECDEYAHSFVKTKDHIRRIVVVGPAVRKKIHRRGDSRSFPQLLDIVEIKFKAKVIHNGKVVHRSKPHHIAYPSGISGQCVHIQILGAKRLPIADTHGSSDPFICVSFGGRRVGTTRTRPRTINPRWMNETYIIPVGTEDEHNSHTRVHKKSQDLVKLEVYDRDYFNFNDFLGHVELTKQQLLKLSYVSNQKPIRLSLGLREYHGRLGLQFGINANLCYLKVLKAESLDKMDAIGLSDPFCEVYFKNKNLGRTNVCSNTLDPVWTSGNVFTFEVEEVLKEEIRLRALTRLGQGHRMTSKSSEVLNNSCLFRIELFDYNSFRPHAALGTIRITCDSFRRLAPTFPRSLNEIEKGKSISHLLHTVRKARNSISSLNPLVIVKPLGFKTSSNDETEQGKNDSEGQVSESFKTKLAEIDKLDHIDEDIGENSEVDPSIANEDDEIVIPEPKEPAYEYEDNTSFEDSEDAENDQDENPSTNIPFLNLRRRSFRPSEESGGSSRYSKYPIKEENSENDEDFEENDEPSDILDDPDNPVPAIFGRTGRSVTPRVNHNLPSYDDEEETTRDRYRRSTFSSSFSNQQDEQLEEEYDEDASKPLIKDSESNGVDDFLEEDPDEEVPNFVDRMKTKFESFKALASSQYRSLFPSTSPSAPSNRRQSLIQMLSQQRRSILDVTVGSTQWLPMKWFDIQKRVEDIVDAENEDRGQLIVRLIPSMRGFVVRGLDVGVKHMTIGETSTVKVRYDYAYGNFWMGPEIPPRSNINFTVQLLSINGSGHVLQIPWRLWLRFYRLMRRNARRIRNGSIEFYHGTIQCWKALKAAYRNYRDKKVKVEEVEEEIIEEIEEEEYDETIDKEESSEESDDDEFNINDLNRGIIAGAGAMWGYDPKKRPKKIKKPKKPKGEKKDKVSRGSTSGGDLSSRSKLSQQSKSSKLSRTSMSSSMSNRNKNTAVKRKLSKASGTSEQNEDDDDIAFENDDSASEASHQSRDSSSGIYSSSTTSRRRKEGGLQAIDESGHRTSTQYAKKRNSTTSKRSR